MSQIQTEPGQVRVSIVRMAIPDGANLTTNTSNTSVMNFGEIQHLLSDSPLRRRQVDEDKIDVRCAKKALAEPERISHHDVRRELGLE